MTKLSDESSILLTTIKHHGQKYDNMGTYFTDGLIAYWYHSKNKASALNESDKTAIQELLSQGLARPWQGKKDEYELTPKGEAYTHLQHPQPQTIHQNFSDIRNSTISNMSNDVRQTLSIESYDIDVQLKFSKLGSAVKEGDTSTAQKLLNGLWASAPLLVMEIIKLGIGAR